MIDVNTKPNQILVVDDNKAWLNTLSPMGIQVFCCCDITMIELYEFISTRTSNLSYVIVNNSIVLSPFNTRFENYGSPLVEKFLKLHFPSLTFLHISFFKLDGNSNTVRFYSEFLLTVNNLYHGK